MCFGLAALMVELIPTDVLSLETRCCRMKRTDVVAKMSAELVKTRHHDVICAAFAELGRSNSVSFPQN